MADKYRNHGDGTILKRSRRKPFLAQLTVNGQRFSKSFFTETEARAWLHETSFKTRSATDLQLFSASVQEGLSIWLEQKQVSWSEKTYLGYRRICDQYIIAQIGRKKIADVTSADIQALLSLHSQKVGPREILYIWQCLSSFFTVMQGQGILAVNPA